LWDGGGLLPHQGTKQALHSTEYRAPNLSKKPHNAPTTFDDFAYPFLYLRSAGEIIPCILARSYRRSLIMIPCYALGSIRHVPSAQSANSQHRHLPVEKDIMVDTFASRVQQPMFPREVGLPHIPRCALKVVWWSIDREVALHRAGDEQVPAEIVPVWNDGVVVKKRVFG